VLNWFHLIGGLNAHPYQKKEATCYWREAEKAANDSIPPTTIVNAICHLSLSPFADFT